MVYIAPKHALGLATEDRLKLVVVMDSSKDKDECEDDDDGGKENDTLVVEWS